MAGEATASRLEATLIEEMRIQGLGVIDDAVLELGPGLTVVTGETGAGKTMVVTGLGLLLGGRADSGLVRTGSDRARVEGRVRVDPGGAVGKRAIDAGADLDDDVLIVARQLTTEGRSRAHLGGAAVPVGLLSELAEDLVAVHGQSDQQRLLLPARQREALDRYAGVAVAEPLGVYRECYTRMREIDSTLTDLTTRARERAQEAELLRHGLAEIEAADPKPREDIGLAAEAERLAHADSLQSAASSAHAFLLGDPDLDSDGADVLGLIAAARRALDHVRDHDADLGAHADALTEVGYVIGDIGAELATYSDRVEADPLRLAHVEERRAVLGGLIRRYAEDVDGVLAWAEAAASRLQELEGDDNRIEALKLERQAVVERLGAVAAQVSDARTAAAQRFGAEVTFELAHLAMANSRVLVSVTQRDDPAGLDLNGHTVAYGPDGVDEVELRLAAHPGAPERPLQKGASGGELSRIMLAVEVVFAGADPVPTFVFDEVDAGVGGKAAVEVGRRLARLALSSQVIVVTHLPQVAAFADRHLVVEKTDDGRVTSSGVTALDDAGRVRELSRMLAGLEDSELGRAHAEELLAMAVDSKQTTSELTSNETTSEPAAEVAAAVTAEANVTPGGKPRRKSALHR